MLKLIKLLAVIIFIVSPNIKPDSIEDSCRLQKSKELCTNHKINSKSACIWDNLNKKCNKDTTSKADYSEEDYSDTIFPPAKNSRDYSEDGSNTSSKNAKGVKRHK